jgi:hypothetical protein
VTAIDDHLEALARERRRRGLAPGIVIDEARDHLLDSTDAGTARGLSREDAERDAVARFGPPSQLADDFARTAFRARHRAALAAAVALGLAIAYVDSRPTWDDAGVTALAMVASAAFLGLLAPQRPWRWAIAIGVWISAPGFLGAPTVARLAGALAILCFPLAGAYAGKAVRRLLLS